MDAFFWIGVLEQVGAVEKALAVRVRREMRRNPVEDDADTRLVQHVDKDHEILRRSVPTGGREVASCLVSP